MSTRTLARGADTTLTEQLCARFADPIRQRLITPGTRLPSVRECARRHEVSVHTVVAAYDRLIASGLIESRRQRGFFVRDARPEPAVASPEPRGPLPVSATTLIRGMFQRPGSRAMPGLGTLPVDWLDLEMLGRALRRVSAGELLGPLALQYGDPAGDLRLRRALARSLPDHGIVVTPDQIITTLGATQALDIVTRTLVRPGEAVLVDEPGWSIEYARLAALGLRVLPVPRGPDGPDLEVMRRLIEAHRPRLYVTVSVLHNPTGASLSLGAAHQVLKLAQAHDIHIVEDDTYSWLAEPHLPRMAALDALERTIYISGFSKILVPNWRVGYIAAPTGLVDRLTDTKLLTTLTTPALTEQAVAHCLETGQLRRHADRLRQKLDLARSRAVRLAEAHGCRFASAPRGLFGWVDVGCDTERLARAMHEDGWLLAPGALFHATHRPTTLLRINFASTQDARFWRELAAARETLV